MTKQIPLTQGKFALVDDDMYDYLSQWNWCALRMKSGFYAVRNDGKRPFKRTVAMHRVIANAIPETYVDHINMDTLDNRRSNLRICTNSQNMSNRGATKANKTGYKGVCWSKVVKKFHAQITANYKRIHIGYFSTPEEAARAYDAKAKELHGDFAVLNFKEG